MSQQIIEGKGVAVQGKEDGSTDAIRIRRGRPLRYTPEEVADALVEAKGMLVDAARKLGCHYQTVKRYVDQFPLVNAVYEDIIINGKFSATSDAESNPGI